MEGVGGGEGEGKGGGGDAYLSDNPHDTNKGLRPLPPTPGYWRVMPASVS